MFFPQEIIVKILLGLPGKSLLRFKSVSKSWKRTISHPYFVKSYEQSSKNNPRRHHLLIDFQCTDGERIYYSTGPSDIIIHPELPSSDLWIKGCCDGLICLKQRLLDDVDGPLYLWNPSINQCRKLPSCSFNIITSTPTMGLAVRFGLGLDIVDNDYKVVKIVQDNKGYDFPTYIYVYSLRTDFWEFLGCKNVSLNLVRVQDLGVAANGSIYCIGRARGGKYGVLAFDIAHNILSEILFPDYISIFSSYLELGRLEGHVALLRDCHLLYAPIIESGSSSVLGCTEPFDVPYRFYGKQYALTDKGMLLIDSASSPKIFVLYDLKKSIAIDKFELGNSDLYFREAVSYVESLIPITRAEGSINRR